MNSKRYIADKAFKLGKEFKTATAKRQSEIRQELKKLEQQEKSWKRHGNK